MLRIFCLVSPSFSFAYCSMEGGGMAPPFELAGVGILVIGFGLVFLVMVGLVIWYQIRRFG